MYRYGIDFDQEWGIEEVLIDFLRKKSPQDNKEVAEKDEMLQSETDKE